MGPSWTPAYLKVGQRLLILQLQSGEVQERCRMCRLLHFRGAAGFHLEVLGETGGLSGQGQREL